MGYTSQLRSGRSSARLCSSLPSAGPDFVLVLCHFPISLQHEFLLCSCVWQFLLLLRLRSRSLLLLCLLLLTGAFVLVAASIVDTVVVLTWSSLACSCRRWCSAGGCRGLLLLLSLFVLSASGGVVIAAVGIVVAVVVVVSLFVLCCCCCCCGRCRCCCFCCKFR